MEAATTTSGRVDQDGTAADRDMTVVDPDMTAVDPDGTTTVAATVDPDGTTGKIRPPTLG